MSFVKKNKGKQFYNTKFSAKKKAWKLINEEVETIQEKLTNFDQSKAKTFNDYPLTRKTLAGLSNGKFEVPTAIQQKTLVPSLRGEDIVGAAKTGSGKTLAFIIPILEKLYKLRWSRSDGVGALVVTPTRELATQIFKVINSVGNKHDFSVGLVTGGKSMQEEEEVITRTNIILATPGRILHHLDKTYAFGLDNLQILVLDEADRMLDDGFKRELNNIIEHLPSQKQTLLYSATQTKMVDDIARLKMRDWLFISAEASPTNTIPEQLRQHYVSISLENKFNFLWTFITKHRKKKALIFVSTCKQARFIHELLMKMQPGVPMLCLHGAMSHKKRLQMCETFNNKRFAYMIATDVAARGLDFRSVDSVMQYDAPEDIKTYIHRVGRTARYNNDGEGWLVLLPSEQKMIQQLQLNNITLQLQKVKADKLQDVGMRVRHFVFNDKVMTDYAKKTFSTYLKSVYMKADKEVFNVKDMPFEAYARSLGLQDVPKVRFILKQERLKEENKKKKNDKMKEVGGRDEDDEDGDGEDDRDDDEDDDDSTDEEKEEDGEDDEDEEEDGEKEEDDEEEKDENENEDDDSKALNNGSNKQISDELRKVRERLKRKMQGAGEEDSLQQKQAKLETTRNIKKLNKKVQNTKIVFDEDKEETKQQRRLSDLVEEMKRQDEVDKGQEKQKRHKERLLMKEKMKKKITKEQHEPQEPVATLGDEEEGGDDEDEDDKNDYDGDVPTIKFKCKKNKVDDEEEEEGEDDDETINFSVYKNRIAQNSDDDNDDDDIYEDDDEEKDNEDDISDDEIEGVIDNDLR